MDGRNGEALVASALAGVETSALSDQEKVLFRFVTKVNADSPNITPEDVQAVLQAGWTEEAVYDAITVCSLFNFYNRWIDATGVHPMTEEAHRQAGIRMAAGSYVRTPDNE